MLAIGRDFNLTWISDERGNKCSVEYFGSEEAARAALASLIDCSGCSDCSDCFDCSDCSRCSRCSDCSLCSDLVGHQPMPGGGAAEPVAIPVIPDIHKVVYEAASAPCALKMSTWHTCETTHCRAGWVVALAGEEGRRLEQFHDTPLAAQLIYQSSGYDINPCRFYDSNEKAMEDMRRLAGQ